MNEIPDLGCACSITDSGIQFCSFHANAEKIVNELKKENQRLREALEYISHPSSLDAPIAAELARKALEGGK